MRPKPQCIFNEYSSRRASRPNSLRSTPTRANLVARLRGNGSKRPILVMGHTDVVGVQRDNWSVDPFAAIAKDGYIYARGSLDDKDNVTAALMLMLLLERADVELDRDVIFLAEAGEEGTTSFGVDYMVENHWDKLAAEYCLAEGGGAVASDGEVRYVAIATTEKFPMRVRLVAHGTGRPRFSPESRQRSIGISQGLGATRRMAIPAASE